MDRSSISDDAAFTRRGEAWSEVTRLGDGAFRVRMGGRFPTAWLSILSTHLAERNVSIDHTHARHTDDVWIAEFHLIALPGAPDLLSMGYIELALGAITGSAGTFALDSYRLLESRDYGGTLMLALEARDSLGLLGSLLSALAELDLYPLEVHIETRNGLAYDSLWLASAGGSPPSPRTIAATLDVLDAALVKPS